MSITLESLVHLQADRDELLQLLSLLNTHWHQNEEAFCNRSLAEWPQWCEDQGFRFALLTDLAHNLESTLSYPEGCPGLDQLITALGPAATTAQLLDSLDQDLPKFLEGFDQLLQISQDETAALGAQAGGSGKGAEWMKDHPGVDAAVAVGGTVILGYAGYRYWRARERLDETIDETYESVRTESIDAEHELQAGLWNMLVQKRLNGIQEGQNLQPLAGSGEEKADSFVNSKVTDAIRSVGSNSLDRAKPILDGRLEDVESQEIIKLQSSLDQELEAEGRKAEDNFYGKLDEKVDNYVSSEEEDLESEVSNIDNSW